MNLRSEFLPYKRIVGEVVLDVSDIPANIRNINGQVCDAKLEKQIYQNSSQQNRLD
jgi:hypothetical protein